MVKKLKKNDADLSPSGRLGEFGSAIAQIAEDKGITKESVIETINAALAAAYKKDYGKKGQHIRAEFNEVGGEASFFKVLEVVDETTREFVDEEEEDEKAESIPYKKYELSGELEDGEKKIPRFNVERDILLPEAKKLKKGVKVGDVIEIELESKKEYGRIAAQTAKQVIIQKIREAERDAMFKEYKEKEGEVINGIIQRIEGRNIFVDIGKSVGVIFPQDQVQTDRYRIGQRLKVYIGRVESDPKGPGITLSRTSAELVKNLFKLEVPEIFAGTVQIKSIAREAGSRTKIAVSSNEEGIDPIGSCVGQKGTRVQAIIDELGGEKIDIVEWNERADKFIAAAMSPAKSLSVAIDEKENKAVVKVPEDQLSLAIGKQGQNVRLAAKLTGWRIDVIGEKIVAKDEAKDGEKTEADKSDTEEKSN